MNRREFLPLLAGGLLSGASVRAADAASAASLRKGWGGGDAALHRLFGVKWYYTWSSHTRPSNAAAFVPMVKGDWALGNGALAAIEKLQGIDHLLGYNEPERKSQGNLSIEEALRHWPALAALAEKRNLRLGSPAPSSDKGGLAWLDAFLTRARKQKLRIDFLCVHWYRSRDADDFEAMIKGLARRWKLPVWVTEFNGWSGGEAENYTFLRKALRFLDRSKDVERYAYFEPGKGKPHSLLTPSGEPTRMGKLYQEAGN